jgi:hypothetical protein
MVRDNVRWRGVLQQDAAWHGKPLFAGEVEPCINGRVVAAGAYFGEDVQDIVERIQGEQMADGGWNCEQERGSTCGSFHTRSASWRGCWSTSGPRAARWR